MSNLVWHTEKRRLGDLLGFPGNPRKGSDKDKKDLSASLEKFGYVELIAINLDETILAGNQRAKTLLTVFGPDLKIDVRVPNRMLTEDEAREYNIRSNKNTFNWDEELLKEFATKEELEEWGFRENELDFFNDDGANGNAGGNQGIWKKYTLLFIKEQSGITNDVMDLIVDDMSFEPIEEVKIVPGEYYERFIKAIKKIKNLEQIQDDTMPFIRLMEIVEETILSRGFKREQEAKKNKQL